MTQFEIKNRYNGTVLYSGGGETLRDIVVAAVKAGAYLSDANLRGADLSGAYLSDADLSGADLSDADLSGADLRGAGLSGADLSDADLRGAGLSGAYLRGADLSDADLRGAGLSGAYLSDADLSGADLRGAGLSDADLRGHKLVGDRPLLQIGPIGSRCATLSAWLTDDGVYVQTGCFFGTLDEFRLKVEATHVDNAHGNEYGIAMLMIEAHAIEWMPT